MDHGDEETTLQDRVNLGASYQKFLESDQAQTCLADQERYFFEAMKAEEDEARIIPLWHRMKAAQRLTQGMQAVIADGKKARSEIDRLDEIKAQGPRSAPIVNRVKGI